MITHEEARELVDRIYVHTDWKTKDKLLAYISQQEKVTELLGLYKSVHGVIQSWDTMPHVEAKIQKLEKELGEMK